MRHVAPYATAHTRWIHRLQFVTRERARYRRRVAVWPGGFLRYCVPSYPEARASLIRGVLLDVEQSRCRREDLEARFLEALRARLMPGVLRFASRAVRRALYPCVIGA